MQVTFLDWIRLIYPQLYPYVIKINNEGVRSKILTHVLKQMGLHPKASDLFIAWPTKRFPGFWLELKRENYTFPESDREHWEGQMNFLMDMVKVGYAGAMCGGFDECCQALEIYLGC